VPGPQSIQEIKGEDGTPKNFERGKEMEEDESFGTDDSMEKF